MVKYLGTFLLGSLALLISLPLIETVVETKPYNKFRLVEETWSHDTLKLRATFVKNGDCRLLSFAVVGTSDTVPKYLPFEDLDNLTPNFDREEGSQGLNILVDTSDRFYEEIELRTRHTCFEGTKKEKVIPKVFYHATNPQKR